MKLVDVCANLRYLVLYPYYYARSLCEHTRTNYLASMVMVIGTRLNNGIGWHVVNVSTTWKVRKK